MEQKRIQAWIEWIPHHIQEVIARKGGNKYQEGWEEGVVHLYNTAEHYTAYTKQLANYANTEEDSRDATIVEDQVEEEEEEVEAIYKDNSNISDGTLNIIYLDITHLESSKQRTDKNYSNNSEYLNIFGN